MTVLSIQKRPASQPGAAVNSRLVWHASVNLLVVGWIAVAASSAVAALYGAAPAWLAVHAFLLGAATTAIVIWSEHFAVAVTRSPQPQRRGSIIRLGVLTAGQVATVVAAVIDLPVLLGIGATVVAGAVAAHGWILLRLRLRGRALGGPLAGIVDYYVAACVALLAGAVVGALLGTGAWPGLHERMHLAHEHLMIGGWVLLTVVGTLFMLWPSAARTRMDAWTPTALRWCLRLAAPGLAVAVAGMLLDSRFVTAFGLGVYGIGIGIAATPLVRTMWRTRPGDGPTSLLTGSIAWLALAVAADAVLTAAGHGDQAAQALGPVVLAGVIGQVLLGSLTFLLPVVIGGGPVGSRAAITFLNAYWPLRVATANLGVVLIVLPSVGADSTVARAGWALIGLTGVEALARIAVLLVRRLPFGGPALGGTALGVVITVAAVLVATSGGGTSGDPAGRGTNHQASGEGAAVLATGRTSTVDVALQDMKIVPSRIQVAAGTHLILRVTNHDGQSHDLRTADVRTPMLRPHQSATLDLGTITKPVDAWCTVPGHRASGMRMTIEVGAPQVQVPPSQAQAASSPARDATLKPAENTTVHRIELPIVEGRQEVAPGVQRTVWTFGGTVPGPTLRGKVGDEFEVTIVNQTTMTHGIDFHAGAVSPDAVMKPIQPGERLLYRFRAERAGIWLYHCSTMPMSEHIAAGMYGAVIIDPPGLSPVDKEYLVVSSELYSGEPGADATMAAIRAGTPDGWMFNGRASQYDEQPLTATAGQRIRFWVLNAGPGSTTSFHVVGAQFDRVYFEGGYSPTSGAQALGLTPAQGGFVEAVFAEPGTYALVDHDMRHAEAGAHGKLVVTR